MTAVTDVTIGAACHHRMGRDLRHAAM